MRKFFLKCTNSHIKEYKLYNKLLNKISLEIELLVPGPSRKDKLTPVFTLCMPISLIQNISFTCSPLFSFSYKFSVFSFTLRSKRLIIEIKKV